MTEDDKDIIHQTESDERITAEDIAFVIYPLNSRMDKIKKKEKPGEQ